LQPLPLEPSRYYQQGTRSAHLDGHAEVTAVGARSPETERKGLEKAMLANSVATANLRAAGCVIRNLMSSLGLAALTETGAVSTQCPFGNLGIFVC
jgi:hypothetical protein